MYTCDLSVTDFSVVIADRESNIWLKVFPRDYAGLAEFILSGLRGKSESYVINKHAIFWVADTPKESIIVMTSLSLYPASYMLSRQEAIRTVHVLCEAEEKWME